MMSVDSKTADMEANLDLAWLLKVRTVVARIGEMDLARWWNSNGQLGPQGASVLRRGLPRTHYFAQTRSVCMVAAARCAQIFDPPGSVTLWRLTDALEERLDVLWEGWLDDARSWRPFFERVAGIKATDLSALPHREFGLVTQTKTRCDPQSQEVGRRPFHANAGIVRRRAADRCHARPVFGCRIAGESGRPVCAEGGRMKLRPEWSQRLLRKGVLVQETYELFAAWDDALSDVQNLKSALSGRYPTAGWEREVSVTLHRRLRHFDRIRPLIALAKGGMSLPDWRDCLRLWIGATEQPFHDFATGLAVRRARKGAVSGPHRRRACILRQGRWNTRSRRRSRFRNTASSARRATCSGWRPILGMLAGHGPVKTFASIAMSDDVTMFYAHMIADLEGNPQRCLQAGFGGSPTCPLRTCMSRFCGFTSSSG